MSGPAAFQSSRGGAPFPRSAAEWIEKGMTPEQAEDRMRREVFGHDYQLDAKGNPIEKGKGSAAQQTAQHLQALDMSREAERARAMRLGWHPGLEHAFDPRTATRPRRKPGRKPKTAAQATPDTGA